MKEISSKYQLGPLTYLYTLDAALLSNALERKPAPAVKNVSPAKMEDGFEGWDAHKITAIVVVKIKPISIFFFILDEKNIELILN